MDLATIMLAILACICDITAIYGYPNTEVCSSLGFGGLLAGCLILGEEARGLR